MAEAHARSGYAPRTPRRGVTLTCRTCGQPYYAPKSLDGRSFYCSLSCSGKGSCTGEKNPFFGKTHTEETRAVLRKKSAEQRAKAPVLPTKPEMAVHAELRRRGVEFLTEQVIGPFCVDILVPALNLVIYVDGCYWHACPEHFPNAKKPRSDRSRVPYLTKCGYYVETLWEHDINKDLTTAMQSIFERFPSYHPTGT